MHTKIETLFELVVSKVSLRIEILIQMYTGLFEKKKQPLG